MHFNPHRRGAAWASQGRGKEASRQKQCQALCPVSQHPASSCPLATLPACQSGQRLILYHFVSILLSPLPPLLFCPFVLLLSLDNDGSAFCKCKIYFAMYKLNVRHINNFVLRWACTNASTMHCTLPGTHSHTLTLATRNSHKVAPFFSFMHYVLILQKFI